MKTFSLQSGSNGNAIYVEAGNTRLLFDAGLSGRQADLRMRAHGREIRELDALIVSHDHSDHVRCAGIYQRKFGLPIYLTRKTQAATRCKLGPLTDVRYFHAGRPLRFGDVTVHTLCTPHDAADGVAFIVEHDGKKLGILTDLGHVFSGLTDYLAAVDACYLESNYDPRMLTEGPYPYHLKQRIRGQHGHLSNTESARLVRAHAKRLQWVALAHLSDENNHPELAMQTHHKCVGQSFPFRLAGRYAPTDVLEL
jgi:phosphoribosyl 1,2-cyclic phosphodiesterase